jgi:hypothetical protein
MLFSFLPNRAMSIAPTIGRKSMVDNQLKSNCP